MEHMHMDSQIGDASIIRSMSEDPFVVLEVVYIHVHLSTNE